MAFYSLLILFLRYHCVVDDTVILEETDLHEAEFFKKAERYFDSLYPKSSALVLCLILIKPIVITMYMKCYRIERK